MYRALSRAAERTGNHGIAGHASQPLGHGLALPAPQFRELAVELSLDAMVQVVGGLAVAHAIQLHRVVRLLARRGEHT